MEYDILQATATCKACGHQFTGKYCNNCGEKIYTDHDKSFFHLIEEGVHFITHFEGTFFRTLRYIFTRPGKLSTDYCYGIRKPLFKPISLFFLLVIVYLLFPVFEGLNMRLQYHLQSDLYGSYAAQKIGTLMQQHQWTDQQVAETFHEKSSKVSKFLLVILLPFTALFFWALTFRKRKYFFDQLVFATEINSVYLIWGFMILPLLLYGLAILWEAITGSRLPISDGTVGYIIYGLLLTYAILAMRRFYQLPLWKSVIIALLFYIAHDFIVQIIYKFLLFSISVSLLA